MKSENRLPGLRVVLATSRSRAGDSEPAYGARLRCNLCRRRFRAHSPFARFCKACRSDDETLRFADWFRTDSP